MNSELFQQAKAIFLQACDLEPTQRSAYLDEACADHAALRAVVEQLLRGDDEPLPLTGEASMRERLGDMLTDDVSGLDGIPEQIDEFRIVRKIGEGGMGAVYEAEQASVKRAVALKIMRTDFDGVEQIRRFEREIELLGQIDHSGVGRIFQAGTVTIGGRSRPYFVMELIRGSVLSEYIKTQTPTLEQKIQLFGEICDAIHHVHLRGVIHRDLKPGNIMVPASGRPVILDFGVARVAREDQVGPTITVQVNQIVGTLAYMSPEQATGASRQIDARSDVYSLGVILYELLSGQLPYDLRASSLQEATRLIREQDPAPLAAPGATGHGDIATIALKALEKEPERRYQSAAEFSADIGRYLRNEPILARPQTALYQLSKFARRNRALTFSLSGLLLTLVAGLASTLVYAVGEREQRQMAEQRLVDLQEFAHKVIVNYQNMIQSDGETEARRYLSDLAQQYLDRLARDTAGRNLEVLSNLGQAFNAVGDALGQPSRANLGDTEGALSNYQKSLEISEDIVRRAPDNVDYQRNLAIACERIGNVHLAELRLDEALRYYQRSHETKIAIADRDPRGQENLSYSYNKLGDVYARLDHLDEAYDQYVRSLEIRRQIADAAPEDRGAQRSVTYSLGRVGNILVQLERREEALWYQRESLERRMDGMARQPDNSQACFDAAVGQMQYAQALAALDRVDEALEAFRASRAILQGLAKDDPGNVTADLGAGELSYRIGQLLFDEGRTAEALPEVADFVERVEGSMEDAAMPADLREGLAQAHQLLGRVLRKLGEQADGDLANEQEQRACTAFQRSRSLFEMTEGSDTPEELLMLLAACTSESE